MRQFLKKNSWLCIVIIFTVALISLILYSLKKDEVLPQLRDRELIIQKDTTPTKEFIRLIDTVIVKEEKIKLLIQEISSPPNDTIIQLRTQLASLQKELHRSRNLPKEKEVIVKVDTVHIPTPSDTQLKHSFLREYSEVKFLDPLTGKIKIHTVSYPKYGFSINTGYGVILPYPYNRLSHGPYIGLGAYFRI